MNRLWMTTLTAAAIVAASAGAGHAQEDGIDKAKADDPRELKRQITKRDGPTLTNC